MENSSSPNCKNILEGFFIEQGSLPAHQGTKSMTRQIGKNQMIAKNKYLFAGAIIFTAAFCSVLVLNISAGYAPSPKKGILLVAFGTSVSKAQISYQNIEKKVRAAFPDIPVRWAYTSYIIRKKLAKQGKQIDSVETALAKMMDEEFTHVAVQSLHTLPGEEFHALRRNAAAFGTMVEGFDRILVGNPLLASDEGLSRVVDAILKIIPKSRKKTDAVVFMGHGTPHPSNAFYAALMYHLQRKDPNVFIGTVDHFPEIDDIKEMLLARKIKVAYLMPFMSVAGDHAINDMAGEDEDSWESILTKAGIRCLPVLKGTAEYDEIVDIWVDHLKEVMSHLR
jgi:sirohydrochlorin cobaltochelatase